MSTKSSSTCITGIAVLEGPVRVSGKTVAFDAQFYLAHRVTLLASLQFFNANDMEFDDVGAYFVCAKVARALPSAKFYSKTLSPSDYHLVGDIIWLIPANIETCDLRHRPWIHLTGVVRNANKGTSSFDVDAAQYTSALKSDRENSVLPVHLLIPDSPKYKNGKPVPCNNNTYVSVAGFVSRFDEEMERFIVDLDTVTFLGRPTLPPETPTTPVVGTIPTVQKLKFSFDDIASPTPLKRRREESRDSDLTASNVFDTPSSSRS